jgi:beta-glucanase (GH16 family)
VRKLLAALVAALLVGGLLLIIGQPSPGPRAASAAAPTVRFPRRTTTTLPTTTTLRTSTTTSTSTTLAGTTTTTGSTTTTGPGSTTTTQGSGVQPLGDPGGWHIILDDEFSQDGSLNTSLWTPYWFVNGGTQNGTVMEASNVSISGGELDLTLAANKTGALVSSNPDDGVPGHVGFQFTYGYAEARIYLPGVSGLAANWAAFWTDGQSWPADGEMDIMETLNGHACYHFHSNGGGPGACAGGDYTGWHTFGAEWDANQVLYFYDGVKVGTIASGITGMPMYLILENSLSGAYGGPSVIPATVQVSYVRVWQKT